MKTDEHEARARKRAEARFGLYRHLAVYLVVNLMLFLINLVTSPDYLWSIWPLMGWGVAIAFHALSVLVFDKKGEILERLTEEELRKDEKRPD